MFREQRLGVTVRLGNENFILWGFILALLPAQISADCLGPLTQAGQARPKTEGAWTAREFELYKSIARKMISGPKPRPTAEEADFVSRYSPSVDTLSEATLQNLDARFLKALKTYLEFFPQDGLELTLGNVVRDRFGVFIEISGAYNSKQLPDGAAIFFDFSSSATKPFAFLKKLSKAEIGVPVIDEISVPDLGIKGVIIDKTNLVPVKLEDGLAILQTAPALRPASELLDHVNRIKMYASDFELYWYAKNREFRIFALRRSRSGHLFNGIMKQVLQQLESLQNEVLRSAMESIEAFGNQMNSAFGEILDKVESRVNMALESIRPGKLPKTSNEEEGLWKDRLKSLQTLLFYLEDVASEFRDRVTNFDNIARDLLHIDRWGDTRTFQVAKNPERDLWSFKNNPATWEKIRQMAPADIERVKSNPMVQDIIKATLLEIVALHQELGIPLHPRVEIELIWWSNYQGSLKNVLTQIQNLIAQPGE